MASDFLGPLDGPDEPIVVSNVLSGTRSLLDHLGLVHARHVFGTGREITDREASKNPWHVPVRDPTDVMVAHQSRYELDIQTIRNILRSFDELMRLAGGRSNTTFYRTEDLPVRAGVGPDHPARHDDSIARALPAVIELGDWFSGKSERVDFYRQYYSRMRWERA